MKFLKFFLVFILISSSVYSNDNIPVKYIDINYIVNNSIVGKKIKDFILKENQKLKKEHESLENKLANKKNEILSKKKCFKWKWF